MSENTERTAEIAGWIRDDIFAGRDAGESLYPVSERLATRIVAALSCPVPDDTADPMPWVSETGFRTSVQAWHPTHGLSKFSPRPEFAPTPVVPVTEGVDLERIEARAAWVAPGPWVTHTMGHVFVGPGEPGSLREIVHMSGDRVSELTPPAAARQIAIADFIAHSREDIDALIAEVRTLRSRLSPPTREALAAMLAEWHDQTEETWEDHIDTAEAVLAFLSSPETEGEKN